MGRVFWWGMQFCSIPFYFTIFILPLFLLIAESKGSEIEIVANGGIVSWVDKENLTYEIDPVTGLPVLNSRGNPVVLYHSYASFKGTSSFQFPNDSNITFLAELDENTTLAYWIVDGEIKMGEQGGSSRISILTLPHPSITIDSNISKIEAVFVSKPSETSALPSPISLNDSTGREIEIIANEEIVSWVDEKFLTYEINPVTGAPVINSRGNPAVLYNTFASFTGSTSYVFPTDTNITFLAEVNQNTSLAFWIVDGEIKMGEQGWSANNANSFIELPHPYITVASNISRIEAVFVSESENPPQYLTSSSGSHKIISNGGIIKWMDPRGTRPTYGIDPLTGLPSVDYRGRPIVLRNINGQFAGTQYFTFPLDMNLTFSPEPSLNNDFAYWVVDGEIKMGNGPSPPSLIATYADGSITIKKPFSTIEAVYSKIPKNSSRYIKPTKSYQQSEVDELVKEASESVTSNPSAYNLVTKSAYDQMVDDMIKAQSANATHYTEGWFYLPNRGWMWTNHSSYPYFYDAEDKDWIYFQSGEEKPRFYRYKTKTWLTIE